ncbi:hypothetical protein STEG23_002936 [Scotinomys teguina]
MGYWSTDTVGTLIFIHLRPPSVSRYLLLSILSWTGPTPVTMMAKTLPLQALQLGPDIWSRLSNEGHNHLCLLFWSLGVKGRIHTVGMFKIHPEIPEALSAEARAFILSCFEPDPHKRATAADLLREGFLWQVNKGKKNRAFKPSGELLGSSSSEHGSISPDSEAHPEAFLRRPSSSINQIHLILFGFQDAVNRILRNHLIRPHWMFAMDNIIRRAVQAAVAILIPELQAHFEPASETEGVDKDTEVEGGCPLVDLLGQEVHETPRGTRPGSVVIQEGQPHQQDPSLQLNRLRQETNRLWEHLIQKEREYQNLLRLTLEQKTQELHHLQLQYKSSGGTENPAPPDELGTDRELRDWLQLQGVDANTIEKIIEEDYTLSDILNNITKEDLRCLRLR